jgi:hypothetical protein
VIRFIEKEFRWAIALHLHDEILRHDRQSIDSADHGCFGG